MKRLIAAIVILLIICTLCILNIPKYTLTTTLSTNSNVDIKTSIELEEKTTNKSNYTKKTKSRSNDLKIGKNEILDYLHKKVIEKGWSEEEYNAIVELIRRESNFKINAVNEKSGACGLFQALPCNKMKKYGRDYKTNYKTQIAFGIDHIKSKYGTPTKALEHKNKKGWY